ncbi:ABC transporter permease subunit [Ferrimonas senticii]|uniref:ABC transporter permease subunit n=1 Tax=Ferrimonas senticii TaxID=394566 RepID=UPI0004297231|nr:ABC transporter permease subunit [Ferrimonas senticii]
MQITPPPSRKLWQLQRLDWALLVAIAAAIAWFSYRASIGVHYQWQWQAAWQLLFTNSAGGDLPYFFQGLLATLRLSLWGLLLALVLGVTLGGLRHGGPRWLQLPLATLIQLVRNVPPLVFIFIFYFFISSQLLPLLGIDFDQRGDEAPWLPWLFGPSSLRENLFSGVLCIGFISAVYIAEIVRSGLNGIPKGQWEAATSLGLSRHQTYLRVIAPQVLTATLPALAGQAIALVKDSSIVSIISIQEMTFAGSELAISSGLVFEIWLLVGLCYLLLCLSLSLWFRRLEQRSQRHLQR